MNSYFSKRFHLAIPSVSSILLASIIAQPAALIAGCCGTGLNFSHSAYAKYIYNLQRSFPTIYRQFGGSRSSGTFPMTYSGATNNNSVQISRPGMNTAALPAFCWELRWLSPLRSGWLLSGIVANVLPAQV